LVTARELVEQLLGLAERLQDPELLAHAHFAMGDTLLWFGELEPARRHIGQALALDDPLWNHPAGSRFGFNCAALSCFFLGRVLWHLGYPDQGLSCSNQAVAIAEAASHAWSQAGALSWLAALHQLRGDGEQTREAADAALAVANEQAIVFFDAHAMVLRGWALVKAGEQEEGIAELRKGLAAYRATGAAVESPHWLALFAEACRDIGQIDEGLRIVEEALVYVARTGVVYHEAELHRLGGELRLACDPAATPAAEACFRRAIEIARAQQAKSWELRAATSLARLLRDQSQQAEARDLLAPVYGWFTEGFDTLDLKEAKALLEELAA
jgi:predicted ATPase